MGITRAKYNKCTNELMNKTSGPGPKSLPTQLRVESTYIAGIFLVAIVRLFSHKRIQLLSVGRRTALMVEVFAQLFLGSILTFCDSLAWFQLLVFLKSLFGGANFFVGIILACEVASNEWRSRFNTIVSSSRLTAIICMVPLANSVPNLETLSCIATLYTFLLVIILRLLPESPQWLLYNRKIFVAEKILYHAAKKNGQKLCSQFKIRPVNHRVRLLTIR
ncbi:unnamed protein product [Chilo suppressalis]|uniref:Major facilitator superfamily (MFS) profile domain-containing protein n=1 Tax=Chilo suppressalis TaxID=168631 RepID=A0ABN8L2D1_CHISP|nr:unnamed protein product [Chilo suppressalis]